MTTVTAFYKNAFGDVSNYGIGIFTDLALHFGQRLGAPRNTDDTRPRGSQRRS